MNTQQERDFISNLGLEGLLEQAVEWIASNMRPCEVFQSSDLIDWAKENAARDLWPDDIFDKSDLADWAEENGFSEEKKCEMTRR